MNPEPLASILRPKTLMDFVGQEHLVAPGAPIFTAIQNQQIFSSILWGPPGVGKTTLAKIWAKSVGANFVELSAVSAGKEDIKQVLKTTNAIEKTILFLDEIHRFNKSQQDFLLPYVESGQIILIGATTENPSFEIIAPLLSRARVFVLKELSEENISTIIFKSQTILGLGQKKVAISKEAKSWLINLANGDARQVLTIIDNCYSLYRNLDLKSLKNTLQNKFLRFDKQGEEHYNTISALIKSMRASNPDAAIYYLARLIASGEDPKFIARRLIIFASEDIGNANPNALLLSNQVFQAVITIGYPECRINLSQGVIYLSNSLKNRTAYDAIESALSDVETFGNLPIPLSLRNPVSKLMKDIGYGKGYEMYTKEDLLPDKLKGKKYYKN